MLSLVLYDSLKSEFCLSDQRMDFANGAFVRVSTGVTFKQAKGDLLKKGWNPSQDSAGDSLYWLNGTNYEKLEDNSWSSIESGKAKL